MPRLFFLLALFSPLAQADLYKWTDAQGRVHFGDQAPENTQAERMAKPSSPPPGSASDSSTDNARGSSDVVQRQKDMLRVLDEDRKARAKQQAEQNNERAKQDYACRELRQQRTVLAGGRVFSRNEKGEPVYLSGAEIDAERVKVDAALQRHCP